MSSLPETRRIPRLLVVYPVVAVIGFGWTVLASVGFPILVGLDVMKTEARIRWDWQLSAIALFFVVNFLYSAVFLLASIGVLRRKQRWLPMFRRCAIVLNAYCVLCAAITLIAIPFMSGEDREDALIGLPLMVSLAAAVALVTRRLLKHLSNRDVIALFR
jgi:amino acid transporter